MRMREVGILVFLMICLGLNGCITGASQCRTTKTYQCNVATATVKECVTTAGGNYAWQEIEISCPKVGGPCSCGHSEEERWKRNLMCSADGVSFKCKSECYCYDHDKGTKP